jgi:hypothetical protein
LHHSGQQDGESHAHPSLPSSRQVKLHHSGQQDGEYHAHPSLPSRQVELHHNGQQDGESHAHPSLPSRQVELHHSRQQDGESHAYPSYWQTGRTTFIYSVEEDNARKWGQRLMLRVFVNPSSAKEKIIEKFENGLCFSVTLARLLSELGT